MEPYQEQLPTPNSSQFEPTPPSSRLDEVSSVINQDDPARLDFLLLRVRQSLNLPAFTGGVTGAIYQEYDDHDDDYEPVRRPAHEQDVNSHQYSHQHSHQHSHPSMSMTEMFPSRSKVNAAEERKKRWAQEWEEKMSPEPNAGSESNSNPNNSGNRNRRQQDHMAGWSGGLSDILSPPRQTNIDGDSILSRTTTVQTVPGYARPLTETDVRGRQDVGGDFGSQPLEAVLRRPTPQQQQQQQAVLEQRYEQVRRLPQPSNSDWGGGLSDVLIDVAAGSPVNLVRHQHRQQTTTDNNMFTPPTTTTGRTLAQISAERAAESESTWGDFEDTFVRRRPPSGTSERRRQARILQQQQQRIINRERRENGSSGGGGGLQQYVSVYNNTSTTTTSPSTYSSDYLTDSALSNISYTDLQSLTPVVPSKPPPPTNILKNLITVRYSESKPSLKSSECAICLEEFEEKETVKRIQCGHCFNAKCIGQWFKVDRRCPSCRFEVC